MSDVLLSEIEPADDAALRAWWEVGGAASRERAFEAWPTWDVARKTLRRHRAGVEVIRTLVRDSAGRAVGAGAIALHHADNTHLADLEVYVVPEARRRGIGSRVLADLEARAAAAGRTVLTAAAFAPVGAESPGSLFCVARGYPVASHEETKLLDLRTAPATWPALDREVADAADGYTIVGFEGTMPEEHLDDFCRMLSVFMTMIPTGDLDLRESTWTPARVHDTEQRMVETGRAWIGALALSPQGRAVGFTELAVSLADPRHATVGGTLVLPEHRGHRLGLGMKLHNHRRLLELLPECQHVETGNAGVNAPMNAVNEAMGYRVVERCLDVQKVVPHKG